MFCVKCQQFWKEAIDKAAVPPEIQKSEDIRWTAHQATLHRNIADLKRASDQTCRICRIIYSAPTKWEHESILKNHDEDIDVVINLDASNGPHPVLSAEFRSGGSGDIKIAKTMIASCSGVLGDDELAHTIDRCVTQPNDHTGSDGALELASLWTKKCLNDHEKCRPATQSSEKPFVPTRLIDVSNGIVRLVESKTDIAPDEDRRFLALSHCWGAILIIRTLKENYKVHRERIPESQLSKTFSEAIHATRKLGYRYLWIDSLCIIQDDGGDWAQEAATMCDVYQCADLTIAAAHATGGDIGCFAERDGLLGLPFYIEIPRPDPNTTPIRIQWFSYGRVADVGGGDPALYGRAWVLQEQLLSPRMLIFDGTQLRWECLTMHGSEGSLMSGASRHGMHYKYIRSGIMDDSEYFSPPKASDDPVFWALLKHQYWCEIVMDYTHRGMTKSTDRLVALAGIANALLRHTTDEYKAGLWSRFFVTGLLWSISHNEKHQISSYKGFDLDANTHVRHKQSLAPSWSWASVTVPVIYAQNELLSYDPICQVLDIHVSGERMDKQSGTARIRGHIRRGYVNPVYPYAITEAAAQFAHMRARQPEGRKGLEYQTFKNRVFHPSDYFLFSSTPPAAKTKDKTPVNVSKSGSYSFLRGSFRPDEVLDPAAQITFLAVAQQHLGSQLHTLVNRHDDDAALKVHALALVPTGNAPNEYRRVGLAVWEQCSWYGYLCGWKDERDRRIYRPGEFSEDGYLQSDGWWDRVARRTWWDDMEGLEECGEGGHEHRYEKGFPDLGRYHVDLEVEEGTVVVV